jgi:alkylhydroperoxidase/carboxymuconolactone decarboxylase family protein YurZ
MSTQLVDVLSHDQIAALQAGYHKEPGALADFAVAAYSGLYKAGSPAFSAFVSSAFTHRGNTPPSLGIRGADRERSIIALLAGQGATSELAIHLYWGLAEGLVVEDLCQIMLLVGGYSGYSRYTTGLGVLARTLGALKGLFPAAGPVAPVAPLDALAAIQKAFAG